MSTFKFAEDKLKASASARGTKISHFYMIGDNPESDIAGGNAKEWTTILVKTGVFKPEKGHNNDRKHPATHVVEDFAEAIDLIFQLEEMKQK